MRLDLAFKCVVTAFTFVTGLAALGFVFYGTLSLLFWNPWVFATIFCLMWALQSYLTYCWNDPEWSDRARIIVRSDDKEEDGDGGY